MSRREEWDEEKSLFLAPFFSPPPVFLFLKVLTSEPARRLQNTLRIKSFFPSEGQADSCSNVRKVMYKASGWDCDDFCVGKTKPRSYDRKTEHFKQQVIAIIINRILRITSGQLVTSRLIGKGES